jgi:polysaccharide biosynthesis PFTS motif protein
VFRFTSLIPGSAAWRRARLRSVFRGYRVLKSSSRLGIIGEIKNSLTESQIAACERKFHPKILGSAAGSSELALRQYLLVLIGGVNINKALLRAAGTPNGVVSHPMPKDWRSIVRLHGFDVSEWSCKIYWAAFVLGMWGYGVIRTLRIMAEGLRSRQRSRPDASCSAYFSNLSKANLPKNEADAGSYDIVSWYVQWPGKSLTISAVSHNVLGVPPMQLAGLPVSPQKGPLPRLVGAGELAAYALWSLFATLFSAVDAFRGRWWHAVLLNQAAYAAQARYVPNATLASVYMFHNSDWIYRPLWTYEVERQGKEVVMYFYATNTETFKRPEGYPPMYYGYRAMNWPRYLVWDEYQADFVYAATAGVGRLDVVGPIWFQGKAGEVPCEAGLSVAVFDVTPTRSSWYRLLGLDSEFYVPETVNAFLRDILYAVSQQHGRMLWKPKRDVSRAAHPRYRTYIEHLASVSNVTLVDPAISAISVIHAATVTISLPFTSTALLARHMGKPSVYYDPRGMVESDDRAAHGIPVLSGPDALETWLKAQFPRPDNATNQ